MQTGPTVPGAPSNRCQPYIPPGGSANRSIEGSPDGDGPPNRPNKG